MIRQWYLLMITLFISVMIMKSINAHSDDDDDDDNDDDDKDFDFKDFKDDYDYDEDEDNDYHNQHDHDNEGHCITHTHHRPSTTQSDTCSATPEYPSLGIAPTDGLIGPRICDGVIPDEAFFRFNAIFFGDFYTYGGTDILGPLAVKGAFHAPDYVVNANKGQDCSNKNSLDSYGLVVGGPVDTKNTQVHGGVYVANGGNLAGIEELENDCIVTNSEGTGLVDFEDLEQKAIDYSMRLAAQSPTIQLGMQDQGLRLAPTRDGMEFITFNSCNPSSLCENIWSEAMSDPSEVLFGIGNYNGIQGKQPDPGITYVFNIPVVETTTITLNTNNPTQGFNGCRVIFNFYPVKADSNYSKYSAFTIVRNTGSPLNGLILAPLGNIRDGPIGNFDGAIIARSYTWAFTNGVEIHDFRAGGGDCDKFEGCTPDLVPVIPSNCTNTVVTTESLTVTSERTVTETSTQDVTFTEGTVTVANTVTSDHTTTVDKVVFNTVTLIEESTTVSTVGNTVTETITSTTPVTTTTTKETTATYETTTTKTNFATVVTLSDTTYTEMNTETITLVLPTTVTTIATDTVVNLIYDTTTVKDVSATISTYTETRETLSVSTATVTLLEASTVFVTSCNFPDPSVITVAPSECTTETHVHTHTHTHDANCGHEYQEDDKKKYKYKKYQEGKHKGDDEDDDEDNDKDYEKD